MHPLRSVFPFFLSLPFCSLLEERHFANTWAALPSHENANDSNRRETTTDKVEEVEEPVNGKEPRSIRLSRRISSIAFAQDWIYYETLETAPKFLEISMDVLSFFFFYWTFWWEVKVCLCDQNMIKIYIHFTSVFFIRKRKTWITLKTWRKRLIKL